MHLISEQCKSLWNSNPVFFFLLSNNYVINNSWQRLSQASVSSLFFCPHALQMETIVLISTVTLLIIAQHFWSCKEINKNFHKSTYQIFDLTHQLIIQYHYHLILVKSLMSRIDLVSRNLLANCFRNCRKRNNWENIMSENDLQISQKSQK